MEPKRIRYPRMREVVFRVLAERPGHLEARAESLPIRITAPTHEELRYEAREALIEHLGPAHRAVRVRVRRSADAAVSSMRPAGRCPAVLRR
jgi:hypothetical protein